MKIEHSLETITIPDSVTTLGTNTFEGNTILKTIVLSNNLTALPNNLFKNCSSL